MISLFLLTLPSWVARYGIRREKIGWKALEDLGVGAFFLLFLTYIPYLSWAIIPLVQTLILFDSFLEKKIHLRLDLGHVALVAHLKDLIDSARGLGGYGWIPLFCSFAIGTVVIAQPEGGLFTLGLLPIPFITQLSKKGSSHLLFHLFFQKKERHKEVGDPEPYLSKNEQYRLLSPEYPLYRMTQGFKGEKTFNMRIKEREKPHIFFLFVESLGADTLGKGETPFLDQCAQEGVFFPNFYSNSIQTFRSLFASLYGLPSAPTKKLSLDTNLGVVGLPDILKKEGYKLQFFNAASWNLNNLSSFLKAQSVDTLVGTQEIKKNQLHTEGSSWGVFDEFLFDEAIRHIIRHRDTPQFNVLMTIATHHPYVLPSRYEPVKGTDFERYLHALSYADGCVQGFINRLDQEGILDESLIFIMGDHGNTIDEKTGNFCLPMRSNESHYHVPLILLGKGRLDQGVVVETPGSQADLLPTVLDLLNMRGVNHGMGSSLVRKGDHPIFMTHRFDPDSDYHVKGEGKEFAKKMRSFIAGIHEMKRMAPSKGKKGKDFYSLNLSCSKNQVDNDLRVILKECQHVGILNLKQSLLLTDKGLEEIVSQSEELFEITLSGCPLLTSQGVQFLMKNIDLEVLNLNQMSFTFSPPNQEMPFLRELGLIGTPVENFQERALLFPSLQSIYLTYSLIDKTDILAVVQETPVQRIYFEECQGMEDRDLLEILKTGRQLTYLVLGDCYSLSNQAFKEIGNYCNLTTLVLFYPSSLTDEGFEALLKLPLKQLKIQGAWGVSQKAVRDALKRKEQYDYLNIQGGTQELMG